MPSTRESSPQRYASVTLPWHTGFEADAVAHEWKRRNLQCSTPNFGPTLRELSPQRYANLDKPWHSSFIGYSASTVATFDGAVDTDLEVRSQREASNSMHRRLAPGRGGIQSMEHLRRAKLNLPLQIEGVHDAEIAIADAASAHAAIMNIDETSAVKSPSHHDVPHPRQVSKGKPSTRPSHEAECPLTTTTPHGPKGAGRTESVRRNLNARGAGHLMTATEPHRCRSLVWIIYHISEARGTFSFFFLHLFRPKKCFLFDASDTCNQHSQSSTQPSPPPPPPTLRSARTASAYRVSPNH
jgi:hypothetical protein